MADVEITSWAPGFNKVACTCLLQDRGSLGLAAAKQVTDGVLAGATEIVSVGSDSAAKLLVNELAAIGASARVVR